MKHLEIPEQYRPGNVVSVPILRRFGVTENQQRTMMRRGELIQLRKGWLADPEADEEVVRAVRSGGVLGCVSVLVRLGAWKPPNDEKLHLYRTGWGRRQSAARVPSCPSPQVTRSLDLAVAPVPVALSQAMHCLPTDYFMAVTESLIYEGVMNQDSVAYLLGPLARHLDASQSGTETIARYRLRKLGLRVRSQVPIDGVGIVDLLVGDRLVIEVDSFAFHTGVESYREDRRRDLTLRQLGYEPMRVTYGQVLFQWPKVEDAVRKLVRARAHRTRTKKK